MSKCIGCYFYSSGHMHNSCSYFKTECFCQPDECDAYSKDGELSPWIEDKIWKESSGNFGKPLDWVPCSSKKMPNGPLRVQIQLDNGWIITGYYDDGYWYSVPDCGDAINGDVIQMQIIAWRFLPEAYKEKK